jgi:hypothetical protein
MAAIEVQLVCRAADAGINIFGGGVCVVVDWQAGAHCSALHCMAHLESAALSSEVHHTGQSLIRPLDLWVTP